jgi:glycosyltransferase involved in cell wall biosynthesis
MNKKITAMVFTFNEERRLPFIYQNLKNFCEIIVFDGGSTDGTEAFCIENNIRFILRPTRNNTHTEENRQSEGMWPGVLNFAYEHCSTDYVLHVFCAHFYPTALLEEFDRVAKDGIKVAVYNDIVIWRYGRIVHQAFLRRVSSACVFYKKSIIDFQRTKIHDELGIIFDEKTMLRLRADNSNSLHLFQDESCISFTTKTIKYVEIEARQQIKRSEKKGLFKSLLKAVGLFLYSYIRLGSFRFGSKGLAYAVLNLQYDISIALTVWEKDNGLDGVNAYQRNDEVRAALTMHRQK